MTGQNIINDMHCLLFNFNSATNSTRSLGCYRIAHFLREHGWDVEVIEYAPYWDLEELRLLAKFRITKNTKWIGTSHIFSSWGSVMEEFCLWLKKLYPEIKIISGSSVNPNFESRAIDYYIQGYGEYAILDLLKYLFSNGSTPKFNLLSTGAKKIIPAISAYPAYPMSSLMVKYQDRDFILPGEWLGVEFSRGCKFSCAHCNYPIIGIKGDYTRDAEDFREQIMDAYDRWGVIGYTVADETFNDRTEKITKFANVVETLPFEPWFCGYIRADLLISRPLDKVELARMGFRGHFYGIESFTHASARVVGKSMAPERLQPGLLQVKEYFQSVGNNLYRGEISLIWGLPGESLQDAEKTILWLNRHWTDQIVSSHPLHLFRSDFDKTSKLSREYLKYGYKEMTDQEIADEVAKGKEFFSTYINEPSVKRFIMWKNSHMNIFDAADLRKKVRDQWVGYADTFSTRPLNIWKYGSMVLHEKDLRSRIAVNCSDMQLLIEQKQNNIVQAYINKKLNL